MKHTIKALSLASLLALTNGCAVVGAVTGPFTGMVDAARVVEQEKRYELLIPALIGGTVFGPYAGFVKGLKIDIDAHNQGRYTKDHINRQIHLYSRE